MGNVDRIRKAVAAVKADRPAYEEVLDFYEKLFLAQEMAKEQVQLEPVQISEELLSIKRKEELPLINREDFAIDIEASETLLREICLSPLKPMRCWLQPAPGLRVPWTRERLRPRCCFQRS